MTIVPPKYLFSVRIRVNQHRNKEMPPLESDYIMKTDSMTGGCSVWLKML